MKGYIIYLPEFESSVSMANRALKTGTQHGWNLELYEGVNGLLQGLQVFNLHPYPYKKCQRYMERPGTQGCFLSQYNLWKKCTNLGTPICIFEHDVIFKKPMGDYEDCDVYKFEGFKKAKPIPPGNWYEGARAYRITPQGADKLINWTHANGAMPADWMLNDGIVEMKFDKYHKVSFETKVSFTKDLS